MMTASWWFIALFGAALPVGADAPSDTPAAGYPDPPVSCVESWPEVRARAGRYDHFVHLSSRCSTPARCTVASDSNPAARHVVVEPWHSLVVLVARGVAESRLVPSVLCRYQPKARPEAWVLSRPGGPAEITEGRTPRPENPVPPSS